jgi:integrase
LNWFDGKIDVIDESFLLVLDLEKDSIPGCNLRTLKRAFSTAPHSALWASGLNVSDFPEARRRNDYGKQISRILAKSLTRAVCVNILGQCERAYDRGEMDISLFSFVNLAFAVFCRPESYRQIQLCDLVFDQKSNAYFLNIMAAKSGVVKPEKILYKINEPLGVLLQKQRQNVVNRHGHQVAPENIDKLALFPPKGLYQEKTAWIHEHANDNFGMFKTGANFALAYPREIARLFLTPGYTISANVLRHTVGTQLAQSGASAQTIQAVLKHASDNTCRAYVDIAFHGLVEELSDAMQPPFEIHFPVFKNFRSRLDQVDAEKAIRADDPKTGKIELTGECGKKIQCEFAPITCYGCVRFIPCWDADHSINLTAVQREIDDYKQRGRSFQQMVEKAQTIKYQIILVMNAADRYQQEFFKIHPHE